ncbi:hypothetical protein [Sporomusa termitida]|uniref:Uncharacterized protein n=1 Tax=Sporomusa termitida TaxID=2377 RepID=A0A517DSK1_9FIRM|nr:hypothetical protein [Sporomusa termitida]QDR80333.1 hypothetical protein SPTER_16560 [Sporomusa termitida]
MPAAAFMEKLNTWYDNLPLRQRYLVLAGTGIILAAAIALLGLPDNQPATRVTPGAVKPQAAVVQPAMPGGYTAPQTMRDPFAPPPGFGKPAITPPPGSIQPGPAMAPPGTTPAQTALPLLVGVVSGGDRQMAIIIYNNTSRAYYPGQEIGPYQLIQVDANSVIVQGPGGQQVLALGR